MHCYKRIVVLISVLLSSLTSMAASDITISFYSENVTIRVDEQMRIIKDIKNKQELDMYKEYMESLDFHATLNDIRKLKEQMILNDWLYYKLIYFLSEAISLSGYVQVADEKDLIPFVWFFLNESGFDAHIDFYDGQKFLYVYSEDMVYLPYVIINNKKYFCLNYNNNPHFKSFLNTEFIDQSSNRDSFSFLFKKLPDFPNGRKRISEETFFYKDRSYSIFRPVHNEGFIMAVKDYPNLQIDKYLDFPMPLEVYDSLILPLKEKLKNKSKEEAVDLLLDYVRSFIYRDDEVLFNRDKWLAPYESLYYKVMDCEDRSILFGYLVREILDTPFILIQYTNYPKIQHINVGVALPNLSKGLKYNGARFAVCETTTFDEPMGENTLYKQYKYEIVGSYFPEERTQK